MTSISILPFGSRHFSSLRRFLAGTCVVVLAGCASTGTGTGWSRAPDLSVYGALDQAREVVREQEILCLGRSPAAVDARWRTQFAAREEWIAAALVARHGADTIAEIESRVPPRHRCQTMSDGRWRRHYTRMLRLLELRLYPADYWSAA